MYLLTNFSKALVQSDWLRNRWLLDQCWLVSKSLGEQPITETPLSNMAISWQISLVQPTRREMKPIQDEAVVCYQKSVWRSCWSSNLLSSALCWSPSGLIKPLCKFHPLHFLPMLLSTDKQALLHLVCIRTTGPPSVFFKDISQKRLHKSPSCSQAAQAFVENRVAIAFRLQASRSTCSCMTEVNRAGKLPSAGFTPGVFLLLHHMIPSCVCPICFPGSGVNRILLKVIENLLESSMWKGAGL